MKVQLLPGTAGVYAFYCPGCGKKHTVFTKDEGFKHPIWGFNGDMDKPTFTPLCMCDLNQPRWGDQMPLFHP